MSRSFECRFQNGLRKSAGRWPQEASGHNFTDRGKTPFGKQEASGHDFTDCKEPRSVKQEASGHDFSRADNVDKMSRALAPEERFRDREPRNKEFLRSLFSLPLALPTHGSMKLCAPHPTSGAPSIERLFARWVGDCKGQPSAIGSFHLPFCFLSVVHRLCCPQEMKPCRRFFLPEGEVIIAQDKAQRGPGSKFNKCLRPVGTA